MRNVQATVHGFDLQILHLKLNQTIFSCCLSSQITCISGVGGGGEEHKRERQRQRGERERQSERDRDRER